MNLRSSGFGLLAVLFMTYESHAATCESLLALSMSKTMITLAQPVGAGEFSAPATGRGAASANTTFKELPAFCRVVATLRPSGDSDIKIEVWMPLANWNNKLQAVGNGGFAGSITYTAGSGGIERGMAEALKRGYATTSTDTGHTGDTAVLFLGHPDKLVDFGYRAVHEMTVSAKAIIDAFYGTGPKFSYWNDARRAADRVSWKPNISRPIITASSLVPRQTRRRGSARGTCMSDRRLSRIRRARFHPRSFRWSRSTQCLRCTRWSDRRPDRRPLPMSLRFQNS